MSPRAPAKVFGCLFHSTRRSTSSPPEMWRSNTFWILSSVCHDNIVLSRFGITLQESCLSPGWARWIGSLKYFRVKAHFFRSPSWRWCPRSLPLCLRRAMWVSGGMESHRSENGHLCISLVHSQRLSQGKCWDFGHPRFGKEQAIECITKVY